MTTDRTLARTLGTGDAVVVGLSAMVGAGVFAVWGPAAGAAGSALVPALLVAAVVALCNALSSAQLAVAHPTSGGTYVYGREVLGPWWGFVAGWGFVVGKTASCAAMAMTFAAYAVPGHPAAQRVAGASAVVVLTVAGLRGVTRTAQVARVLLGLSLAVLVLALALGAGAPPAAVASAPAELGGVLQGAGLLFFAFAGYARIATLAEEVRSPSVITRAVLVALAVAVVLYTGVALLLGDRLGGLLPGSQAPLSDLVRAADHGWAVPVVAVGAAAASLGALLALLAGVSRTGLAMGRGGDLPRFMARVSDRQVPAHAELAVGAVVVVLVLAADLRGVVGFSSFGVLVYYAVANLSALAQPADQRRVPRVVQVVGLVGCLGLAVTLPATSSLVGLGVLLVGVLGRLAVRRGRPMEAG